jgi:phosphoribosylglycinamide formyltransferase 1
VAVADQVDRRRRIGVLVSGSGSNLQALIDAIARDRDFGGRIVVVASDRPDAQGLDRARAHGIPTVATALDEHPDRLAWEKTLAEGIAEHAPDLLVLAGFMRILSSAFLERWPQGILNIHPSLLPAFPGAHAVSDALAHGVKVTGTTVHLVSDDLDGGPIIAQRAVPVRDDDDEDALHDRIKALEHEILPAVVKLLCHGRLDVEGRHVRIRPAADATALTILDVDSEGDAVHGR